MSCPCNESITELDVVDSRRTSNGGVRRRRRCARCGAKATTYEVYINPGQTLRLSRPPGGGLLVEEPVFYGLQYVDAFLGEDKENE